MNTSREAIEKLAVNLRCDPAVIRRLKIHALQNGVSISSLVEKMIVDNIPDYTVAEKERAM